MHLNETGDAIRRIERQQIQNAVGAASEALGAGGLNELQRALELGETEQLQKASRAGSFCPYCGEEVDEGYRYCRKCGRELPEK